MALTRYDPSKTWGIDQKQFFSQFEEPAPERRPFAAGMEAAKSAITAGLPLALSSGSTLESRQAQEQNLRELRESAARQERLLPGGPAGLDQGLGRAAYENLLYSTPQMAATALAGAAGGIAGGPVGAGMAATAAGTPFFAGSNVARATEGGRRPLTEEQRTRSLAVAPLQAAADVAIGAVLPGVGRGFTGGALTRMAKGAAVGAGTEAVTEAGQQAGERYAAGLSLTDREALREYGQSAAIGGLLGGAFGGVGGAFNKRVDILQPPAKIAQREPITYAEGDTLLTGMGDTGDQEARVQGPSTKDTRGQRATAALKKILGDDLDAGLADLTDQRSRLMNAMQNATDTQTFYKIQDILGQFDATYLTPEVRAFADRRARERAYAADTQPELGLPKRPRELSRMVFEGAEPGAQGRLFDAGVDYAQTQSDMLGTPPGGVGGGVEVSGYQRDLFEARPTAEVRSMAGTRPTQIQTALLGGEAPKRVPAGIRKLSLKLSDLAQSNSFDAMDDVVATAKVPGDVAERAQSWVDTLRGLTTAATEQEATMARPSQVEQQRALVAQIVADQNTAQVERGIAIRQQQEAAAAQQQAQAEAAAAQQAQITQNREDILREFIEQDPLGNPVNKFFKALGQAKGTYGEVFLRPNERALYEEARTAEKNRRAQAQQEQTQQATAQRKASLVSEQLAARQARITERKRDRAALQLAKSREATGMRQASRAMAGRVKQALTPVTAPEPAAAMPVEAPVKSVIERGEGPQPTVKKEKKRAAQKRKQPAGGVGERVRANEERETAEAGGGNRPVESREEPKAVKQKAEVTSAKTDKYLDRIYDLATNLDRKGLISFARTLRLKNEITADDMAEVETMSKDKDMGPEDIGDVLRSIVELAGERAAEQSNLTYEDVMREADSYLSETGEGGALTPQQYQKLSIMADEEAVTPQQLKNILDSAVESNTSKAVERASKPQPKRKFKLFKRPSREQLDVIRADMQKILEDMGFKQATVMLASGKSLWGMGEYDPLMKIITVAYDLTKGGRLSTLHHEVIHYLRDIKVITDEDWAKLSQAADNNARLNRWYDRNYKSYYSAENFKKFRQEEVIAEMFSEWMNRKQAELPGIRGVFGKIRNFFRDVFGFYERQSFATAEEVFSAIADGTRTDKGIDLFAATPTDKVKKGRTAPGSDKGLIERNIAKLPPEVRGTVQYITDRMGGWYDDFRTSVGFTENLIDHGKKFIQALTPYLESMQAKVVIADKLERRLADVKRNFGKLSSAMRSVGSGTVNEFLQRSTMSGKWGYQPEWLDTVVDIDPEIKGLYDALDPDARAVADDVFRINSEIAKEYQRVTGDSLKAIYAPQIAEAEQAGNALEVTKLKRKLAAELAEQGRLLNINANLPYASLRRYGDYIVIGKSAELKAAIAEDDAARIKELMQDENHYFVDRYDNIAQAKAKQSELAEAGLFDNPIARQADLVEDELVGGKEVMVAVKRIRDFLNSQAVGSDINPKMQQGMNSLLTQLSIRMLRNNSPRKAELRRLGVGAGDLDMMYNFFTQGRADAHALASLQHDDKLVETMKDMRRQAGSDTADPEAMQVYNEVIRRHISGMNYKYSPGAELVRGLTSTWVLSLNPSYFLVNATQPWVMSLPYMGSRHGEVKTAALLGKAYREIMQANKGATFLDPVNIDGLGMDVRGAIQELADRGRIDVGMEKDLGDVNSLAKNALTAPIDKLSTMLRNATSKLESVNRIVTAATAYRLELERNGGNHAAAVDYADKVIYDTHFAYDQFNAPRWMRGPVLSTLTQFKKFQLGQLSLLAKLLKNSVKGESPEVRAAARKMFVYVLGHTALLAGGMGLPGAAALEWAINKLFGDEDEPVDIQRSIRKSLGDGPMADLILKGAPSLAGLDLSSRIGMGQALSVIPYTDVELTREGYAGIVTALSGPAIGGLGSKMFDAMGQVSDGDYYRGLETAMPGVVGSSMRAYREATEGMTRRNKDLLLSPEDISAAQTLATAMGLKTTAVSRRQAEQSYQYEAEEFYKERAAEMNQRFIAARKADDSAELTQLRKDWADLQDAREENGFKRQPYSNLLRAAKAQQRREKRTVGGVQYRSEEAMAEAAE